MPPEAAHTHRHECDGSSTQLGLPMTSDAPGFTTGYKDGIETTSDASHAKRTCSTFPPTRHKYTTRGRSGNAPMFVGQRPSLSWIITMLCSSLRTTLRGSSTTTRSLLVHTSSPTSSSRLTCFSLVAARRRLYSSESRNDSRSLGSSRLLIALASITSGIVGYTLAQTSTKSGTKLIVSSQKAQYGTQDDFKEAVWELRRTFASREDAVSTQAEDLQMHGFSQYDYHPASSPSVVVYPASTEDVVQIVKIATKYRMPIIPYSGATSLEGHFRSPAEGGICVDLSSMDQILQIHEADSDLVCQPGARWMDINDMLKEKGIPLFFPIDPGPSATIGGMLSTGCSGTNAVRYGTAKAEWFLNATVVLPSGEVIKTRRRSRKSSAGFDTTKLFIGAEGTLGIVTEVTIRLAPVLPTTVAVVQFPDIRKATEAVIEVMNKGVGIQCVELLDASFMKATNIYGQSKRKYPERDSLFFKFQGPTPASLAETAEITRRVVEKYGGTGFALAESEEEATDLWADRKNAYYAGLAMVDGGRGWGTDVCVPVSNLPDLIYQTQEDLAHIQLTHSIIGHVGDGNFHAMLIFKSDEELPAVREAVDRMVRRAIKLDGTCTGEHGVGIGKKKYLVEELGIGTVELMKTIKRAIDPLGLFNPGKLYPDTDSDTAPDVKKVT